ncbi:MAG TPA: type IV secretion system DNA-binding domain-containing protein [Candidatus Moranbacteria bacterium]|nr:type IV secretion system DNA-binding domain-containing protein [Candidatus Moranbacteria bacterium]HRZ33774.1 type IV secretion system DNA-binding domain-containing protein [Candidatus Moranbacteria bacterium]
MDNEINFFAKTNFRNQERAFGIKTDDRRRHMYVIGKTGMGKTNLLENMAVQDIRSGKGVCFIDPHGDTAEKLIKAMPSSRINDVIYLNPADQNFPLAFNVMEAVDPEYRHLVASGLIGVFKKIWADSWGPRLEYILRNAILALLEYPGSTLLGVTRILVDKRYREKVVDNVSDPVVKQFWIEEFSKWNERVLQEVISPIQNKVGQFLSSSLIRNIVGQTKSSFNIREVMDSQKILILNLSKGRIGEDNSALLGAMMITKIQLAAMERVDIPEETRKDFYLYVDEFQNFATESFANILSEARKYRLNLILANQYIAQIDEKVRDAIFGNTGTIVSFRVGATDAEFLEKEFSPVFMQNDLVNIPKYQIYLKLMIDGIAGDAFSATVLPPIYIKDTLENEEKIITVSRERYASSKIEVEEKIAKWAGIMPTDGFKTVNKAPEQVHQDVSFLQSQEARPAQENQTKKTETDFLKNKQDSQKDTENKRPMFGAVCDMCASEIQVPFQPDGKRPTFCKECLKDYQRMTAKEKIAQERKKQRETEEIQENKYFNNNEHTKTIKNQYFKKSISLEDEVKREKENPKENKFEHKAYIPNEKPMALSQMQYIAPKKFKPQRHKPNINLNEVRNLIIKNAQNKSKITQTQDDEDYDLDKREIGR